MKVRCESCKHRPKHTWKCRKLDMKIGNLNWSCKYGRIDFFKNLKWKLHAIKIKRANVIKEETK